MNTSESNTTVLVTGATGFVASHCIKHLLESGFKVRGTVRSLKNAQKNKFLYDLVPEKKDNLQLVEADLLNKSSWPDAIKGSQYILHVASPMDMTATEAQTIKPAVEGTLNILEAALKCQVKRVVLTGALFTAGYGMWDQVITEKVWSTCPNLKPYEKSKFLAEKAAWDFYEKNKGKIEMNVILPGFIVGPVFNSAGGSSEKVFSDLMTHKIPGIPNLSFPSVDVRDLAVAHKKAMLAPSGDGKRYISYSELKRFADFADDLRGEFGKYGYKIPKMKLAKWMLKMASCCDKQIKAILPMIDNHMNVDCSYTNKELEIKYRPLKESCIDMVWSLIKLGAIPDKTKKSK
jgi:dihydroflavonol-4-reductase